MKEKVVKLAQIKQNKSNPRQIKDKKFSLLIGSILSFDKMLQLREVVVDVDMTILGGNMRYMALLTISQMAEGEIRQRLKKVRKVKDWSSEKMDEVVARWMEWKLNPTVKVKIADDLSDEEKKEFIIKDNSSFGDWDNDMLANEWDTADLTEWGLDVPDPDEDEPQRYVAKVVSPVYEPKGERPSLKECVDRSKCDELVKEIEASNLDKEVKAFLKVAAHRHVVFNYEKIAEYYAQAPKEVQGLMERSALVIIDFNQAIENGFVKATEWIKAMWEKDNGSEGGDNEE